MRSFFIYILFTLSCILPCHAQVQDFDKEGLKGLSSTQLAQLDKGEIVESGSHQELLAKHLIFKKAMHRLISPRQSTMHFTFSKWSGRIMICSKATIQM